MAEMKGDPAEAARAVLAFWFGEVGKERWWVKDAGLDAAIAARFGALREAVVASRAKEWRDDPETLLAAIILCDQFSRNIYRGSRKAFEADALARELTMTGARARVGRGHAGRAAPVPADAAPAQREFGRSGAFAG